MSGENEPGAADHELLIRIDERVRQAMTTMEQRDIYHRAEMDRQSKMFLEAIASFSGTLTQMATTYASKVELIAMRADVSRLERTVYGAVAVVMLAFIAGLVALVFKKGGA